MTILVISDIHANLTALQAVLNTAGTFDAVWCLGDLVGYGPDPNECIQVVRSLPNLVCLVGNHDAAALGQIDLEAFNRDARQSAHWTRLALKEENLAFLAGLPEKNVTGQITLAHGSPRNPVWEYLMDRFTVLLNFSYFDTPFCFVGHTHMPHTFILPKDSQKVDWYVPTPSVPLKLHPRAILNPGSVGQPRDRDPRASYALFDPQALTWEIRRVEYDIASVQQRISQAGLPHRHATRLAEGF